MSFIILLLIIVAACGDDLGSIMTIFVLGFIGMTIFGGGGNVVGVFNLNDK